MVFQFPTHLKMKNSPLNNLLKFSGRSFQNDLWKSHNIKKKTLKPPPSSTSKKIFAQILLAPNSNNSNDYLCCDVSNSYHLSVFFCWGQPHQEQNNGRCWKRKEASSQKSAEVSRRSHHPGVFVQLLSQGWHFQNRPFNLLVSNLHPQSKQCSMWKCDLKNN